MNLIQDVDSLLLSVMSQFSVTIKDKDGRDCFVEDLREFQKHLRDFDRGDSFFS